MGHIRGHHQNAAHFSLSPFLGLVGQIDIDGAQVVIAADFDGYLRGIKGDARGNDVLQELIKPLPFEFRQGFQQGFAGNSLGGRATNSPKNAFAH